MVKASGTEKEFSVIDTEVISVDGDKGEIL
jgi:hypothetical protein